MKKVIITKGLPASGKSTWARAELVHYPGCYKIVSKDGLRAMLDDGVYNATNEKFVLKVRDALILLALEAGFHVIVDDTNLHKKHEAAIRDLVKGKAAVEIQDFTAVSLETCIERDRRRPNYVGEVVIRQMYRDFLAPKPPAIAFDPDLPNAILCDLDGTLALRGNRNPYDASTCEEDQINPAVQQIIEASTSVFYGDALLLVSGRSEQYRPETQRWLKAHGISYAALYMRPEGDNRKDVVVKQELYEQHIAGKYNVKFVLDDRNQCVALWRSLGLTALQVADGDF